MFKQILITIVLLVLIFFIVKKLFLFYYKLVLSKGIIKYTLNDTIKNFIDMYSHEFDISFLNILSSCGLEKNILFYTDTPWSTKNNNYIYSLKESKYYIIDKNHYYYLDSIDNFEISIDPSQHKKVKIKLFDYPVNSDKIVFI